MLLPSILLSLITGCYSVAELAQLTRQKVRFETSDLYKHVLYVQNLHMSRPDSLNLIAEALNAEVHISSSEFVFARSKKRMNEIEEKRIRRRLTVIERFLKTQLEGLCESPSQEAILEELRSAIEKNRKPDQKLLDDHLPTRRFFLRLLGRLGADALSKAPTDQWTIYEDQPLQGAKPLPANKDLLDEFKASLLKLDVTELQAYWKSKRGEEIPSLNLPSDVLSLQNIRLRVSLRARDAETSFQLEAYDPRGNIVFSSYVPTDSEAPKPALVSGTLNLSESELKAFEPLSPSPLWNSWLSRPAAEEPSKQCLEPIAPELFGVGRRATAVIDLADFVLFSAESARNSNRIDLTKFSASLRDRYENLTRSNALIWRPTDPISSESAFADRKVMEQSVARVFKSQKYDFRAQSVFMHQVSHSYSPLGSRIHALLEKSFVDTTYRTSLSSDLMRLIGAITDDDWNRLLRGESRSVSQLGINADFDRYIAREYAAPVTSDQKIPDVYRHIDETFDRVPRSNALLQVRRQASPALKVWMEGAPEPKTAVINQPTPAPITLIPVRRKGESYIPVMSRETFESQFSSFRYRRGVSRSQVFSILCPHETKVVVPLSVEVELEAKTFLYQDLPEDIRLKHWNDCLNYSISIVKSTTTRGN